MNERKQYKRGMKIDNSLKCRKTFPPLKLIHKLLTDATFTLMLDVIVVILSYNWYATSRLDNR